MIFKQNSLNCFNLEGLEVKGQWWKQAISMKHWVEFEHKLEKIMRRKISVEELSKSQLIAQYNLWNINIHIDVLHKRIPLIF
jgi:hypothetical protein